MQLGQELLVLGTIDVSDEEATTMHRNAKYICTLFLRIGSMMQSHLLSLGNI